MAAETNNLPTASNPFPLLLNVDALKTAALMLAVGVLVGIWLCKSKKL